jgi:hemerythrin-like domain-containing protein
MIASYVGRWSQVQQEQLSLCEKIDQIAVRLPLHDAGALDLFADQLTGLLDRVHGFEEEDLFPVLEAMSPQMRPLLVTFRSHHLRDRAQAQIIADALAQPSVMTSGSLRDLKLQLEFFSETLRRHVQFEEAIALALFASRRIDERRALQ